MPVIWKELWIWGGGYVSDLCVLYPILEWPLFIHCIVLHHPCLKQSRIFSTPVFFLSKQSL